MRSWVFLTAALPVTHGIRIIASNDDGWAESNLRTLFNELVAVGNDVVLSAPALDKSGTGSSDAPPTKLGSGGCEFSSCPPNSPATGSNKTDPRLNYVNSYPVTAIKTGISVTAPALFNGAAPQLAVAGPNVGSNLGSTVQISGTVGAASYAAATAKIPAIAFSGKSGSQISYTTPTPIYAKVYADLATNVTQTIIKSGTPYLPDGVFLNVNFGTVSSSTCNSASQFRYILTRITSGSGTDTSYCGSTTLPTESSIIGRSGCFVAISPAVGSSKATASAAQQAVVLRKLQSILSCP